MYGPKGEEEGGVNWKVGIHKHTLLCMKWVTDGGMVFTALPL